MKSRTVVAAVLALSMVASGMAHANECSSDVQSAMDQSRMTYVNGMNGLASNNFSSRPGTYSIIACLDKFMKGSMDIFFKPPQLTDLLGQVLNFACQQAKQAMSGGGGGGSTNLGSLIGSLAGGLSVPGSNGGSQTINLNQVLGAVMGGGGGGLGGGGGSNWGGGSTSSGIQGLFR